MTEEEIIPIEEWGNLKNGQLYISLYAVEGDAKFYGGSFETDQNPLHDVKLGIVITHYNRKHYVLPAVKRLKKDILDNPYYGQYIKLAIIDNSRNITEREAQGITVVPNPTYGGSGGFSRGLLYWKDKKFTHCLFMDDDASCETESIYRTLSILQYARLDNLAVSGAMLREAECSLLWCKGEFYKRFEILSSKRGLDMRFAPHLLLSEEYNGAESGDKQYGGFWHFAFPIAKVKKYPFPFFIRGDDLLFGLSNEFHIVTMNGIGNFADDFCLKESPFIAYLALRCNFMVETAAGSASADIYVDRYKRWIRGQLYSYHYSRARAISLSVSDFMEGLSFWRNNMDTVDIRKRLASMTSGEFMQKNDVSACGKMRYPRNEKPFRKLFRKITRQGFLLPSFMIKRRVALIAENFGGHPAASFRSDTIFYYGDDLRHGYYAKYDKKRFFEEWRLSRKICKEMKQKLPAVLADYRANWQKLASEKFWREIYVNELTGEMK